MLTPINILFAVCVFVYMCYTGAAYSKLRSTRWYFPIVLACEILGNIIWVFLLKRTTNQHEMFFYTMLFDVAMVIMQVAVPLIFFDMKLSPLASLGVAMTLGGVLLLKYELT